MCEASARQQTHRNERERERERERKREPERARERGGERGGGSMGTGAANYQVAPTGPGPTHGPPDGRLPVVSRTVRPKPAQGPKSREARKTVRGTVNLRREIILVTAPEAAA